MENNVVKSLNAGELDLLIAKYQLYIINQTQPLLESPSKMVRLRKLMEIQ